MRHFQLLVARGLMLIFLLPAFGAFAQSKLDRAQVDQLTAPIALYPDALLSQVLMAATYPQDVAEAAQWSKANPSLSGDAATKAVARETWDPSVQSLAAFPSVLDMMGREPKWVQSVGDAFLAQPDDVMDSVQRLRKQAQSAGSLKTTEKQKVVTETTGSTTVVKIEPASPQVVYVPSYNPTVVYGAWPYPAYPPAYYPPPPGSVFATSLVAGIGFGLGVAAVNSMWGGFNWGSHDVNVNVNRYNNINVNHQITANSSHVSWQHNAANRGNVAYSNANLSSRYDQQRQAGLANRQQTSTQGQRLGAGGAGTQNPRDAARANAAQSFENRTGQPIAGHSGNLGAGGAGTRASGGQLSASQQQRVDQLNARNNSRAANQSNALSHAGSGFGAQQQSQRASQIAQRQPEGGLSGGRAGGGGGHFGHGRR